MDRTEVKRDPLKASRPSREVRDGGRGVAVASHGEPAAMPSPCGPADTDREGAHTRLLARLAGQPAQVVGPWTRDELYER